MPSLRHRLVTLLIPLVLGFALASTGFGHRFSQPSQDRAFIAVAALMGVAKSDLCSTRDTDHGTDHGTIATSCEACRLVSSTVLPERTSLARDMVPGKLADWPCVAPEAVPLATRVRSDPARAPPVA